MTRYTDVGRKRKYLDAGFSPADEQTADDAEKPTAVSVVDQPENPPPMKKRKHTKHKQTMKAEEAPASPHNATKEVSEVEGEGRVEDQQVKNAYSNREENRKKEALRYAQSEQRREKRKQEKLANTTCFACREKGHAAKDCPKMKAGGSSDRTKTKFGTVVCYRCGSSKHTLSRCKKPENRENPLPYASCYVCSGKGHIASSCSQNKDKGVYPNGGNCKICGETSHLARNCPTRKQDQGSASLLVGMGHNAGADEDDFHSFRRVNAEIDLEERTVVKAKKMADVRVGVMSKTVKSFATAVSKKKVVVF